jgi:glycosidase
MIRKYISILPLVAALFLAFSCDPTETKPEEKDTLTVNTTSLAFEAEDVSAKFVSITTKGDWKATPSDSWIHMEKTSGTGNGTLTVKVDANPGADRSGSISVTGAQNVSIAVSQKGRNIITVAADPDPFDGNKRSSTTYQLLIYSFADSDGDGIGDFKGIQNKLDYLDDLGATALWLSPAHPSDSYHAYDVTDYYTVNPLYGTEQDFKNLIDAAHAKGIRIYMDYVLNHSGKGNAWFKEALADPASKYRDYYFFSSNPQADYSKFPMLKGTKYVAGEWKQATSGSPKLTITKTDEPVTNGNATWNLWLWQDGGEGKVIQFTAGSNGSYYAVLEINGKWGVLVRKYMNWDAGSKFGASGNGTITEGKEMDLVADGGDMSFSGTGRYKIELTHVATETLYYMGCFSDWMPDLNYGDPATAETNACFLDLAQSADKWIKLGVDGLRLDAVKHICGGIDSFSHASNRTLLKKWYEHCNATYKAAGHSDNIFMVAEEWDGHDTEKSYYQSLTSCFEFEYFGALTNALNGNASSYVSSVNKWISDHTAQRADAITSIFMTNHDQDRAAESLGRSAAKEKQAAAMMLTTPGKPFVYQGEELGYYGKKSGGDEYVRTPMMWDKAGKDCAKKGVNGKVDTGMLKAEISVEAQNADAGSLLNVYKTWSRLRNTYPALAEGTMSSAGLSGGNSIAAWYMTAGNQKLLVIHNTAGTEKTVTVSDNTSRAVGLLGTATLDHDALTLGPNSSVVFKL